MPQLPQLSLNSYRTLVETTYEGLPCWHLPPADFGRGEGKGLPMLTQNHMWWIVRAFREKARKKSVRAGRFSWAEMHT